MKKWEIVAAVIGSLVLLGGLIYGVAEIINCRKIKNGSTDDILYST